MTCFQVKLGADWKDFDTQTDKVLKSALKAGSSKEQVRLRGEDYIFDFKRMVQINTRTEKERSIRPPGDWKLPNKPLVPPGPKAVMTVKPGDPGTTVYIPHPKVEGAVIFVRVPARAKVGQTMLVPVPPEDAMKAVGQAAKPAEADSPASGKGDPAPHAVEGPSTVVIVKAGDPGTTIHIPHPKVPGAVIGVRVPARAKVGQKMLVPVPPEDAMDTAGEAEDGETIIASVPPAVTVRLETMPPEDAMTGAGEADAISLEPAPPDDAWNIRRELTETSI
mmetsp:Transcript_117417/g.204056  ORF Transcript_117417/g.204056 Transcript_117417/m.204056 type:complete len:278 (-) Transcript_117417:56-889(-)